MRGSDQVFAPTSDAENRPESGDNWRSKADAPPTDVELGKALMLPDTDPERVAYRLWNAGKLDEAIQFLEREIAAERGRHRETALVPATGLDMRPVEPASDWRERHMATRTKPDFNAFGANVRTIDVTATPADAIVAHGGKRRSPRTWIMGLVLIVGLGAAGTAFWPERNDGAGRGSADQQGVETLATATDPVAVELPETSKQGKETALAEADAELTEAPPPETEVVETLPPNPDALAELPPPAGAAPINPIDQTPTDTAATAQEQAPEDPATTASIASQLEAQEQAATMEAPLPRPRPEPSPEIIAALNAQPAPHFTPEPPVNRVVGVPNEAPIYGPNTVRVYGPHGMRVFRPVRRLPGAPRPVPGADPFFQRELTPAEYQALLERRAWAEHYAAQRRAGASPRIITLP